MLNLLKTIFRLLRSPKYNLWKKDAEVIDIYITTYRRSKFLARSLKGILEACHASSFRHRVIILGDRMDFQTMLCLIPYYRIVHFLSSPIQLGLPFLFNLVLQHNRLLRGRTEIHPKYLCYIQDDCTIKRPDTFFEILDHTYTSLSKNYDVGFISGFYTPIHPGFEKTNSNGNTVLLSDSIDGKHIMGPPSLFESVGELTWTLPNGERRGNPGPKHGSHFDLWQWKESPNSTQSQGRINLIVPGLISSMASSAKTSTWNNPSDSEKKIRKRVEKGRIYNTREDYPVLTESDFYGNT